MSCEKIEVTNQEHDRENSCTRIDVYLNGKFTPKERIKEI